MADVVTPNMGLTEPTYGVTTSPTWPSEINQNFVTIDGHNHSTGSGVQITPAGLNINADLPFGSNNATGLRSTRYARQSSVLATASDLMCISAVGTAGDLYWNDNNGNKIQITQSGGVAGTPGSISGLVSPASATWVAIGATFVWAASAGTAANMDAATLIIRYPGSYPTPSGNHIAIHAPSSLATAFSLTLPATLPAAQSFLTLDALGAFATPIPLVGGITPSNLATANTTLGTAVSVTNTNTSPVTVTSAAITTVGRPIRVEFQATASGVGSMGISNLTGYTEMVILVKRNGTTIQQWVLPNWTQKQMYWPSSSLNFTDRSPASGTNTYSLVIQTGYASSVWEFNGQLFLMEI